MIHTDAQDRPVVTGISGPTMAGSFEYYRDIPVLDDLPFGLGAVLLILIETSGLP
jgi:unsaturated rhamnogalacturonyl hydrolase